MQSAAGSRQVKHYINANIELFCNASLVLVSVLSALNSNANSGSHLRIYPWIVFV